jgi:hypothetical protein
MLLIGVVARLFVRFTVFLTLFVWGFIGATGFGNKSLRAFIAVFTPTTETKHNKNRLTVARKCKANGAFNK